MADYQEIVDADLKARPGYVGALLAEAGECLLLNGEADIAAEIIADIIRVHELYPAIARALQSDVAQVETALKHRDVGRLLQIFAAVARLVDARLAVRSGAIGPAADGEDETNSDRPGNRISPAA